MAESQICSLVLPPFTSHISRPYSRCRRRWIRRICSAVASNLLFCNARMPRFSLYSGWLAFPSIRRRNVGNIRSSLFPPRGGGFVGDLHAVSTILEQRFFVPLEEEDPGYDLLFLFALIAFTDHPFSLLEQCELLLKFRIDLILIINKYSILFFLKNFFSRFGSLVLNPDYLHRYASPMYRFPQCNMLFVTHKLRYVLSS